MIQVYSVQQLRLHLCTQTRDSMLNHEDLERIGYNKFYSSTRSRILPHSKMTKRFVPSCQKNGRHRKSESLLERPQIFTSQHNSHAKVWQKTKFPGPAVNLSIKNYCGQLQWPRPKVRLFNACAALKAVCPTAKNHITHCDPKPTCMMFSHSHAAKSTQPTRCCSVQYHSVRSRQLLYRPVTQQLRCQLTRLMYCCKTQLMYCWLVYCGPTR